MSHVKDDYKMFTYLGQKIKNTYLIDSACMEVNLRDAIGAMRAFAVLSNDHSLDKFIEPLRIMALYGWHRMEVTDLSLMMGENMRHVSFKKRDGNEPRGSDTIQEDSEEDL